jgi:hypothetical protein
VKHKSVDISWFGTGYSNDSPYGEWREEGTLPPQIDTCKEKDYINRHNTGMYTFDVYIPLVVDSPNKSFSNLSGLTDCIDVAENEINGKSKICTASSGGTITPTFNFSQTNGKFYYRWKATTAMAG